MFQIKMNRKLLLTPTIHNLDRPFSVSSFATHLKPKNFDGTSFPRDVFRDLSCGSER